MSPRQAKIPDSRSDNSTASGYALFRRLLGYVLPYWRTFALGIVAMVVLAATQPAIPALLKPLLDGSFVEKNPENAATVALLFILVFFILGVAAYMHTLALAWVAGKLVMDLRGEMFAKLTTLPLSRFDQLPSGILISKLTFDTTQVTDAGVHVITVMVRDTLTIVGLLAWMLYLEWRLTCVVLLVAPLIVFIIRQVGGRLRRMGLSLQESMGKVTHTIEESIDGRKVVRIFSGQNYEQQRFGQAINHARRFQFKFIASGAVNSPLAQFIISLALAAVIYIAVHQTTAGTLTVGEFISFFTAMALLFSPLKRVAHLNGPLQKGLAAAESIFRLLDEPAEADHGTLKLPAAKGELRFEAVSQRYAEAQQATIDALSTHIPPGQTIALVGPSGSGKTTLVNLIPRFYPLEAGRILLDGVDISELQLDELRRHVALVSQDVVLFNDTLRANIAYGALRETSETEIIAAARSAHAMEFIERMPEGLDTEIGADGLKLSHGQRQRIAIARAFLKNAPVLILDEATSALDSATEQHIQAALEDLRQGRTTLVIAHRLSTIENADCILVMRDGAIVESGTHTELLAQGELYSELYRLQYAEAGTAK